MEPDDEIAYWKDGSNRDWEAVEGMVEWGRELHWALFIMHLSLEKALKANFVHRMGERAPHLHNLRRLAELGGLEITEEQAGYLESANAFHIEGRYPDEKMEFYRLAQPEFVRAWKERLGSLRQWIIEQI